TGQDPSRTAATAKSLTGKAHAPNSSDGILRPRTGVFPRNRPGTKLWDRATLWFLNSGDTEAHLPNVTNS
ncbi:hypothetical protein, partial [Ruegeria sediminis]|uniref:hypothetical protein n=1 Tax=Ruegeria sediminis TaxID=2583820 RepID=UPI001C556A58